MPEIHFLAQVGVYVTMFVCVVFAVLAVTAANLFRAALALTGVLLGIAGIYIALHAEFLAMVQVLIYVGAVMTLVIFAIMLTERLGDVSVPQTNSSAWLAWAGMIGLYLLLVRVMISTPWPVKTPALIKASAVSTAGLGEALLGPYVFPFEILSVVLIAALVGAIVVARKDDNA